MAKMIGMVQPQHEICKNKVDFPTVVIKPFSKDANDLGMFIQWFGETKEGSLPKKSQFLFDVLTDPNDIGWYEKPETFRVVFLGQIKDWPKPEKVQSMAKAMGSIDKWIVWLVSSYVGVRHSDGIGPASNAIGIALLADGNYGVITPQPYTNMKVLEEESQKITSR